MEHMNMNKSDACIVTVSTLNFIAPTIIMCELVRWVINEAAFLLFVEIVIWPTAISGYFLYTYCFGNNVAEAGLYQDIVDSSS